MSRVPRHTLRFPTAVSPALIMKYGPKSSLSPTLGDPCGMCGRPLSAGQYTTLARGSNDHRFPGTEVHWACAARRLARGTTSPAR